MIAMRWNSSSFVYRFVALLLGFVALPGPLWAQQAAGDSAAARRLVSWTSDRRSYSVGDVLTVVIAEQTVATDRSDREGVASRSLGAEASGTLGGSVLLKPLAAETGFQRGETQRTHVTRQDRFSTEIAVQVVEVLSNGALRVRGEREVMVDKRTRTLSVEGIVRPEDISATGHVLSSRLADARIHYNGKDSWTRGGLLGRLLGWLWP